MKSNVSTVVYRSNLYPVIESCHKDRKFQSKIHDPFSLEKLKKFGVLTEFQRSEFERASMHCAYAEADDYPWGTFKDKNGNEYIACRCLKTDCIHFKQCRRNFDPAELTVFEDNKIAQSTIFIFEEAAKSIKHSTNGNEVAAAELFEKSLPTESQETKTEKQIVEPPEVNFLLSVPNAVIAKQPQPIPKIEVKTVDFSSFVPVTQNDIIETVPTERCVVNAGPGTGKTWTLIEKIIYMINEGSVDPENILVLCFSRSAVDVVKSRLACAAEDGRVGYEWQDIDVRTFDSFATYLLVWLQDNRPGLLPNKFMLEMNDYDSRINIATSAFKREKDLLADYEHIIVDEVQDLVGSRAEMVLEMLNSLPETCGFTVLGDSCQALYDYMVKDDTEMMSSENFYKNIFRMFSNAHFYSLTENHRQGDEFGELTVPYREAILTGTKDARSAIANNLLSQIPRTSAKLSQFSREEAMKYVQQGTLGILTRTNSQALQVSAWLRNEEVPHLLHRGLGSPTLGDWIAEIFCNYEHESIDESTFLTCHLAKFPSVSYDEVRNRWYALISTIPGESKQRYEVSDLLKGLLGNAKESVLFESGESKAYAITVSNIHRAKGKEFDSVIVIDDVIESMAANDGEDLLEHKVCYVALTRPKKQIERAEISQKDKQIYITRNEDGSKRCAKAGGFAKRYISHFEVGSDTDVDTRSLAMDTTLQQYIQNSVSPGTRLKLKKCPEDTKSYVVYKIVLEDNENIVLGYTGETFANELEKAIKHILKLNSNTDVYFNVFPHAFCDIYVHNITTCISSLPPVPDGAKTFGNVSIWSGLTITGFAAVDKDTY